MKKSFTLLIFLSAGLTAHSQVLLLESTATTVGHEFSTAARSTIDSIYGSFWDAVPAPTFTASLSAYDTLRITVSAPEGFDFTLASHTESEGGVLSFGSPLSIWHAPGWDGGSRYSLPTTVSFTGFSGPGWYSVTTGASVDTDGLALVLEGAVWWSGAPQIRFTSVTLEADLSSLSAYDFPSATFSPDLAVGIKYQNILPFGTSIDPGPAVSLTAIPEPSTYAAVLGILACLSAYYKKEKG